MLLGPEELQEQEGLEAYASTAYVNFIHFFQLENNISNVTAKFLQNAWESSVAFQVIHNQPAFNFFIVTYSGQLDGLWDLSKFSLFCGQVKTKTTATSPAVLEQLVLLKIDSLVQLEQVVILMDPCITATFWHMGCFCKIQTEKTDRFTQWSIKVCGHSDKQYLVLEPFSPHIYQALTCELWHIGEKFMDFHEQFDASMNSRLQPKS